MTSTMPCETSSIGPLVTGRDGLARRERRAAAGDADEPPVRRLALPPALLLAFLAPFPLAADAPEAAFF